MGDFIFWVKSPLKSVLTEERSKKCSQTDTQEIGIYYRGVGFVGGPEEDDWEKITVNMAQQALRTKNGSRKGRTDNIVRSRKKQATQGQKVVLFAHGKRRVLLKPFPNPGARRVDTVFHTNVTSRSKKRTDC